MADQPKSNLFRQEALEQLSSPEQLDQLIQVVRLKDWIPLTSIGFLVSILLGWSLFGRIPVDVQARGLLLQSADAQQLMGVSYFPIATGKQIQPNDAILIVPDTVQFQQDGGIWATVSQVSPAPVTREALLNRINGNQELADLVYQPASIEVVATLQTAATPTGYQWSIASGPEGALSSQTPMTARVILREQSPIAFVFSFLQQ